MATATSAQARDYIGVSRFKLACLLPFAFLAAVTYTAESIHAFSVWDSPIVEGVILKREVAKRYGVLPGARLTIQIVGTPTTVVAETNGQNSYELPDSVRFHYNEDPDREVYILGEEKPQWPALFCWIFTAFAFTYCIWPLARRTRRPEIVELSVAR